MKKKKLTLPPLKGLLFLVDKIAHGGEGYKRNKEAGLRVWIVDPANPVIFSIANPNPVFLSIRLEFSFY